MRVRNQHGSRETQELVIGFQNLKAQISVDYFLSPGRPFLTLPSHGPTDDTTVQIGRKSIIRSPKSAIFSARTLPGFTNCEVKLVQGRKPGMSTLASRMGSPNQPYKASPPNHSLVKLLSNPVSSSLVKRVTVWLAVGPLGPKMAPSWHSGN